MFRKKKTDELDVASINELVLLGRKILSVSFTVIIIASLILGLSLLRTLNVFGILKDLLIVISPVFIGLILAWLFDPIADFLVEKKIPRILSCIIIYLVFISVLALLVFLIVPSFIDQIADFIKTIPGILNESKDFVSSTINSFSAGSDFDFGIVKQQIFTTLESIGTSLTTNIPNTLFSIGMSLVSGGMNFVLGLMIGFYMLYDFDKVKAGFLRIVPRRFQNDCIDLGRRINTSLRGYVTGLLTVMTLVFISQSICLTLAGLEAPLIFALFCAVTDIIPYVGPYIGAVPAVIVGFTISPFTGICCIIAIVIVQLLENNFYQPLIMGHAMKLHPVTIMLGLLIFQHFFGIIGMIIATPVIATLKVIFMFIDEKIEVMKMIRDN